MSQQLPRRDIELWRYLTFQLWDTAAEHAHVLANGGCEGMPITRFKNIAIGSMILDPDGNWIELSQRAAAMLNCRSTSRPITCGSTALP